MELRNDAPSILKTYQIEEGKRFQSLLYSFLLHRWNTVAVNTWLQLEPCMRPTSFEQFLVQRQLLTLLVWCAVMDHDH